MRKLAQALDSLRNYTQKDYGVLFSTGGHEAWLYDPRKSEVVSPKLGRKALTTWIAKFERSGSA